jgi:hypothetical protein
MEGTYRSELENDGTSLLILVDAADRMRLKLAIPWDQISEAVSQEVRARFTRGDVAIHFVGARDALRFSLRDLTESWVDRFDPSDATAVTERETLLGVLRDCIARIEATATLD